MPEARVEKAPLSPPTASARRPNGREPAWRKIPPRAPRPLIFARGARGGMKITEQKSARKKNAVPNGNGGRRAAPQQVYQ